MIGGVDEQTACSRRDCGVSVVFLRKRRSACVPRYRANSWSWSRRHGRFCPISPLRRGRFHKDSFLGKPCGSDVSTGRRRNRRPSQAVDSCGDEAFGDCFCLSGALKTSSTKPLASTCVGLRPRMKWHSAATPHWPQQPPSFTGLAISPGNFSSTPRVVCSKHQKDKTAPSYLTCQQGFRWQWKRKSTEASSTL
ncbi:hypothetical protein V5799_030588 [Amblyomma americanum]|uniref:Uncharacterized protein n=1 Tax=Amblyomma americanum TaxID=6943 RepID=A0AAQ4EMT3_AMBAM